MKATVGRPPNWDKIVAAFPEAAKRHGVLFCYGDTIYNPSGVSITPDLWVHEGVHERQQGRDPDGWWDRYIADPVFRLEQEIEAYRAQLALVSAVHGRDHRRKMERRITSALASALYGGLVTKARAKELLAT